MGAEEAHILERTKLAMSGEARFYGERFSSYRTLGTRDNDIEPEIYFIIWPGENGTVRKTVFWFGGQQSSNIERLKKVVRESQVTKISADHFRQHAAKSFLGRQWASILRQSSGNKVSIFSFFAKSADVPIAFFVIGHSANTGRQVAYLYAMPVLDPTAAFNYLKTQVDNSS